jgi:hypothetical protein
VEELGSFQRWMTDPGKDMKEKWAKWVLSRFGVDSDADADIDVDYYAYEVLHLRVCVPKMGYHRRVDDHELFGAAAGIIAHCPSHLLPLPRVLLVLE